ncbi:MAG: BREX system Lon protease-like protein BrxL, partial [Promethearchaeota archaeon]
DRIAGFIPGWQLHPIRKRDLSMNYGLIGDWFSELLHAFRRSNSFLPLIESMIDFKGEGCRLRDVNNMRLTASAFVKLLFPDKNMVVDDWHLVARMAVALRQGVIDQLALIDPEYRGIHLSYDLIE